VEEMAEMMNANDARLADLFTAASGGLVEDDAPNAAMTPAPGFDLILQAEAGSVLGNSGATYTLYILAVNENTGGRVPALDPPGQPFAEAFANTAAQPFGWLASAGGFVKTEPTAGPTGIVRYAIVIPPGVTLGRFHYNAALVATNYQVVSIAQSNTFILV
jgi:hypothetical protein